MPACVHSLAYLCTYCRKRTSARTSICVVYIYTNKAMFMWSICLDHQYVLCMCISMYAYMYLSMYKCLLFIFLCMCIYSYRHVSMYTATHRSGMRVGRFSLALLAMPKRRSPRFRVELQVFTFAFVVDRVSASRAQRVLWVFGLNPTASMKSPIQLGKTNKTVAKQVLIHEEL